MRKQPKKGQYARWFFVINGETMPHSYGTRLAALLNTKIDPFVAAMDFPRCFFFVLQPKPLAKEFWHISIGAPRSYNKPKKLLLTKKEKAFLIRRLAYD